MLTRRLGKVIGLLFCGVMVWHCGCNAASGKATIHRGQISTQFEVSWGTTVKIGFPGQIDFTAEGEGFVEGNEATRQQGNEATGAESATEVAPGKPGSAADPTPE